MFSSSPAGSKSGPCSFSSRRAAWTDQRRRSSVEQRSKARIRSTEILTTCTLARWSPESVLSQSSTQSACTHVHGHETWSWSRRAMWSQNREENLLFVLRLARKASRLTKRLNWNSLLANCAALSGWRIDRFFVFFFSAFFYCLFVCLFLLWKWITILWLPCNGMFMELGSCCSLFRLSISRYPQTTASDQNKKQSKNLETKS